MEEFGATEQLLAMLAGGGQGGTASSVVAAVWDAKPRIERLGKMLEGVEMFLDYLYAL